MRTVALALIVGGLLAGGAGAEFTEDFDTFTLGVLAAQQDWEAHASVDVVTTTTDGLYTGGRALESTSYTDKTTRHDATGVDFDLIKNNTDGYEFGYDIRSDDTTAINMRMYMRRGTMARYSPSVGFLGGKMILRPLGETGTNIYGNDFASDDFYGEGTVADPGYWLKGDWLRIKVILNGTDNKIGTVKAFNLSRGNLEIPTGLTNVDMTSTAQFIDGWWSRFNFRNGTDGVLVDNAYVTEYISTDPFMPFSDTFESYPTGTEPLFPWVITSTDAATSTVNVVSDPSPFSGGTNAVHYNDASSTQNPKMVYDLTKKTTNPLKIQFDFKLSSPNGWRGYAQFQIVGADGGVDMFLALTHENSDLANFTGTYQSILDTDMGIWYHVDIVTSPINPSGSETYDISVTEFGGSTTVVTNLPFRFDVDTAFARVQFVQNNISAQKSDITIDNFSISENLTPYEKWEQFYELTGTNADYTANPDGDALNNLYEWGLGGDPTDNLDQGISPTYGIALDGGINWFVYVYPSNSVADDLVYYLETDTNLIGAPGWTNANYEAVGTSPADVDGFSYVTNRLSTAVEDQQFIRLIIE